MTDKEVNEAVARKLRWIPRDFDKHWQRIQNQGTQIHQHAPPDYCHNISAAWEIFKSYDGGVDIHFGSWKCRLNGQAIAEADTAPMAICKAFLKLP